MKRSPPKQPKRPKQLEQLEQLRSKYHILSEKYTDLVHKYERATDERVLTAQLAWWALRTGDTALAMVREGQIMVANVRWHALGGEGGQASWQLYREGAAKDATARPLDQIAREEAAHLLADRAAHVRVVPYQRAGDDFTLELRFERLELPGARTTVAVLGHDVSEKVR